MKSKLQTDLGKARYSKCRTSHAALQVPPGCPTPHWGSTPVSLSPPPPCPLLASGWYVSNRSKQIIITWNIIMNLFLKAIEYICFNYYYSVFTGFNHSLKGWGTSWEIRFTPEKCIWYLVGLLFFSYEAKGLAGGMRGISTLRWVWEREWWPVYLVWMWKT